VYSRTLAQATHLTFEPVQWPKGRGTDDPLAHATWHALEVVTLRPICEHEIRERTYEPVATIRATRTELLEREIELRTPVEDGTWSEAGPIQEAILEIPSGEQPLLIWHLTIEELPEHFDNATPLELRAPRSTADPSAFVRAFLAAADLPEDRADWIVSQQDWVDLFG